MILIIKKSPLLRCLLTSQIFSSFDSNKFLMTNCNSHTTSSNSFENIPSHGSVKHYTVCVEGNIASGKSTLLEYFSSNVNIQTLPEPVDKWRNINGHNALQLMYDDPSRWGFMFHSYVQLSMLQQHTMPYPKNVYLKLIERSIYSDRYCFIENLKHTKKLCEIEYEVLDHWHQWMMKSNDVKIDRIIYLQASPKTCYERLKNRSRKEEENISLEFLQALHDLHERWLIKKKYFVPAPVLTLDGNLDNDDMIKVYKQLHFDLLNGKIESNSQE